MNAKQFDNWLLKAKQLSSSAFKKPLIMGILNLTPDSFSDGGHFTSLDSALKQALALIESGADLIDLGGESTKPGAEQVSLDLELTRVLPVIEQIRKYSDICISIDTYKPQVMKAAVEAGANIINDVFALRKEGALSMASQLSVPVCLMHMDKSPQTMQNNPIYEQGIMNELALFFAERMAACKTAGISHERLILDPGFGFGKTTADNLKIVRHIDKLQKFKRPILLGVSRKSTIGTVLNQPVDKRLIGSIALAICAAIKGTQLLRVHDVEETKQALQMINAIY